MAVLALLHVFNSVFNQEWLLFATVPWGNSSKTAAILFMHLLLRQDLSRHLGLAWNYVDQGNLSLWQFSCLSFLRVEISGVRHYV